MHVRAQTVHMHAQLDNVVTGVPCCRGRRDAVFFLGACNPCDVLFSPYLMFCIKMVC